MTGPTPAPWTQGGISNPDSDNPTTWIYGPRAAPDHQSGPCIAKDVRLADAPMICAAPETAAQRDRLQATVNDLLGALRDIEAIVSNPIGWRKPIVQRGRICNVANAAISRASRGETAQADEPSEQDVMLFHVGVGKKAGGMDMRERAVEWCHNEHEIAKEEANEDGDYGAGFLHGLTHAAEGLASLPLDPSGGSTND